MKTPTTFFIVLLLGIFLLNTSCSKEDGPNAPEPVAKEETIKEEIEEEPANNPPDSFNLIGVIDGVTDVDVYPTFSWEEVTDPDGDTITYNLYLGREEDPTQLYAADLTDTSYELT
ncbi:hypothetical protein [Zobellia galactanivorans]|uniref:hypothetical protein n=1 Tax=Zobellia galactanivorans (strain DSM 12802 / CCUG 47099 / CIP 106680 / NCIMB 13871 / Dsij) TaxID=63186 RepID=UPI001C0795EE|nr:hypothetical protein [Zobellia galactanivorans]MBU3024549.1 hypothetical protein [Zobellia galactanivorans]